MPIPTEIPPDPGGTSLFYGLREHLGEGGKERDTGSPLRRLIPHTSSTNQRLSPGLPYEQQYSTSTVEYSTVKQLFLLAPFAPPHDSLRIPQEEKREKERQKDRKKIDKKEGVGGNIVKGYRGWKGEVLLLLSHVLLI